MYIFLTVVIVLAAILITLLVLVQNAKGVVNSMLGREDEALLSKWAAAITTLGLDARYHCLAEADSPLCALEKHIDSFEILI